MMFLWEAYVGVCLSILWSHVPDRAKAFYTSLNMIPQNDIGNCLGRHACIFLGCSGDLVSGLVVVGGDGRSVGAMWSYQVGMGLAKSTEHPSMGLDMRVFVR